MYRLMSRYVFLWSFAVGVLLGVCLYRDKNTIVTHNGKDTYDKWFNNNNYKRNYLAMDMLRYGDVQNTRLESQFLFDKVKVKCVLLVRKRKNAAAANSTWARECNDRSFIYLSPEKEHKIKLPIRPVQLESSWLLLCEAIRSFNGDFHWVLFLNDDTFALPENVRRMVAVLDYNKGYYLGHAITFWGTEYNVGQAGYVLSRGSIELLKNKFNSTEQCTAGGRFWKQEDFYLGKHLASLGVKPSDTRDSNGLTTFHGHSLAQLLTPGSISSLSLSNYYKFSIFPASECCSPYAVTFQTVEADKMYTNHYILYQLQVFRGDGHFGNKRRECDRAKDENVWKSFVREQKGKDMDITPQEYYELWKTIVNDPVNFNQNIRKWSAPKLDTESDILANNSSY